MEDNEMTAEASSAGAPPEYVLVVAAAIRDLHGRWLLQQRPAGKHHGGLWEFPGGKVERGEQLRPALVREISEELGLTLDPALMRPLGFAESEGGEGRPPLVLLLFAAEATGAEPHGHEGQLWGWFSTEEVEALPLPPLDRALLPWLPD